MLKCVMGVNVPPLAFIGEGRPLNNPISKSEVAYAARKLNSNRATGPDQIQNELLKSADAIVYNMYGVCWSCKLFVHYQQLHQVNR